MKRTLINIRPSQFGLEFDDDIGGFMEESISSTLSTLPDSPIEQSVTV